MDQSYKWAFHRKGNNLMENKHPKRHHPKIHATSLMQKKSETYIRLAKIQSEHCKYQSGAWKQKNTSDAGGVGNESNHLEKTGQYPEKLKMIMSYL